MTSFEQVWHDKYMNNLCTLATLNKLVNAGKLTEKFVENIKSKRQDAYGY